jgi:ribonucleoside-diphosphate reductase alpha chain
MGIYSAEERTRQVETGSYLPADSTEESDDAEIESMSQSVSLKSSPAKAAKPDVAVEVKSGAGAASAKHITEPRVHSSAELLETLQGHAADAPMCMTCGVKMRPAGSCHVCEGCGSTSGCS